MIYKSYLVEENFDIINNNIVLFYGENIGLLNEFKNKIKSLNKSKEILVFSQSEILKDENNFFSSVTNTSLFEDKNIFFINDANDKILEYLKKIEGKLDNDKIFLFSGILDKKSKLRKNFENSKNYDVIACYEDNELSLKKIITSKLKDFIGITPQIINILIENSSASRIKLNNEIQKIRALFLDKKIDKQNLEKLINAKSDENFELIKDTALKGNKIKTNSLLSTTSFESDKTPLYLTIINNRLIQLRELSSLSIKKNLSEAINNIKPPIFWKDKPNFIDQAKIWTTAKIKLAMDQTYELELKVKSNTNINKEILLKKLLLDICNIATA